MDEYNSHSRGCTAESGSLQTQAPWDQYVASSKTWRARTSQWLAIVGGGRRGDAGVLQIPKFSAGLGGL